MRLYTSIICNKLLAALTPYLYLERDLTYIWSTDGLLQMEGNKLYRQSIKDVPLIKTIFGAYPVTLDASTFLNTAGEEEFQVVPGAKVEQIKQKMYRLSPTSLVNCVFEYNSKNELMDQYFSIEMNGLVVDVSNIHANPIKGELMQYCKLI